MSKARPAGSSEWVYESIIRSVPGVNTSRSMALAVQLVGFESGVLSLSWYYGRPETAIAGTIGVVVAVAGSILMLRLSREVRAVGGPRQYGDLLFGSRLELLLGLLSFLVLVIYSFVYDPFYSGGTLLSSLVGTPPSLLFTFLLLLIAWDVAYRIGVGWWASVLGLWRSYRFGDELDESARQRYRHVDALNIGFASVQLLLVPVLSGHVFLQIAVIGHVIAVGAVSGVSILLLRRSVTNDDQ